MCRDAPGYNVTLEQQHLERFAQERRRRCEAAKLQAAKQRAEAARLAGLAKEVAAERLYADKKSTCNKVGSKCQRLLLVAARRCPMCTDVGYSPAHKAYAGSCLSLHRNRNGPAVAVPSRFGHRRRVGAVRQGGSAGAALPAAGPQAPCGHAGSAPKAAATRATPQRRPRLRLIAHLARRVNDWNLYH